ncbi:Vacuolar fusion protein mon1 [Exophiala xenobiotica]|uniref:Vacuolar fusion protein MON1 n=1 Tax=Lithohypha guttulata TaxID=1690604 RepID=A0ABR0KCS1_9EURO|nr:Vacuolar fusion protein mon1 [Lithohypha guttulata]KAK5320268.1 Vacuolar fusion protein mon1 [Exophiala xenobiotica]
MSHRDDPRSEDGKKDQSTPARPPLPPRPTNLSFFQDNNSNRQATSSRPPTRAGLVSSATTALSTNDVNAYTRLGSVRKLRTVPSQLTSSPSMSKTASRTASDTADDSSIRSYGLASEQAQEESIFGDGLASRKNDAFGTDSGFISTHDMLEEADVPPEIDFEEEFEPVSDDIEQEEVAHEAWKAKKKHFLILSAAGKPIYTRHGSDAIISSYVGIIQTIISSYDSWNNQLRGFQAKDARFVILSQTNLFLVAISNLSESEAQLRSQLDALYTQILSTLTLPTLTHIFSVRPSTDLRRPLQGTEVLLSALADSFTRGSPSTLLSALESLRLRKSHRTVINNTMVKARVDELLYGLIVAGGRLVSVIRPKKHSLHPGDLHLIFNMLFEAEGIKAGGGESFIPICLPGFNKTGYLYMYVSFLDVGSESIRELGLDENIAKEDAVAIILLSANKESFEDLRSMKGYLVHELRKNGSMKVIHKAVQSGRPLPTDIVPGTALRHFLYKSKGNVQFFMPAFESQFSDMQSKRQLFSIYHALHASVHAKYAAVKVQHIVNSTCSALAWVTPMFELYCIASAGTSRNALAQNANKVVQYIQREEERIFLIGGAVF